jgi:hypothetical protein
VAVTYKGNVTSTGTSNATTGLLDIDVTALGLAADDFLIVAVARADQTTNLTAPTCGGNVTGSLTNDTDLYGNDTKDINAWTWSKKLTGADTLVRITTTTSAPLSYSIRAYSGLDATTQLDTAVVSNVGTNGSRPDPTAITTVTNNAKVVAFYFAAQTTDSAWTAPSGLSNWNQAGGSSNGRVGSGDADKTPAGSYDPAAVTGGTTSTSDSNAFAVYALRPNNAQTLTPSLFTSSQTFYAPTVSATYGLTPPLFTNGQTFYAPTVGRGTVALTPSLFTNSQTFFSASVSQGFLLQPALFTNSQSFFGPTVTPGGVSLSPSLFANTQTFHAATVTQTILLSPALFTNTQVFYSPQIVIDQTLLAGLFTNESGIFIPTVTYDRAFLRHRHRGRRSMDYGMPIYRNIRG